MPQSQDQTAVANLALHHLGLKTIGSIDQPTEYAQAVERVFDISRQATLRSHQWRFANTKQALSIYTPVPPEEEILVPGWQYAYSFPAAAMAVRKVFLDDGQTDPNQIEYEIFYDPLTEAQYILCNEEDAYIEYTADVTVTEIMDPIFILAWSFEMAALLSPKLTADKELTAAMERAYNGVINSATLLDAREQKTENPEKNQSSFLAAR